MTETSRTEIARARRYAPPVLRLAGRPVSPEAGRLVSRCLASIVLASLPPQRPTSVAGIEQALGATWAGLLGALEAEWGDGWTRRPLANGSFTGEPVSRVHFGKVLDALQGAGLVEIAPGFQDRATGRAVATRVRLTDAGRKLAADYGITREDIRRHFVTPSEAQDPQD